MGRWVPTNSSAAETPVGTFSGGTQGGSVVSGTANNKGSWVTNVAWLASFEWNSITVNISQTDIGDAVMDIGYDNGGSAQRILIPDLRIPSLRAARVGGYAITLPLHVPRGMQLAMRSQSTGASHGTRVSITGHSGVLGGGKPFSRCIKLYTVASSRGVDVDPGAVANARGNWVELIASSADRVAGLFAVAGHAGDIARAAAAALAFDIGIGAAGSERPLIPNQLAVSETAIDSWLPSVFGPWPCDVPAGTRFAANAQINVATAGDRVIDLALWGLVA